MNIQTKKTVIYMTISVAVLFISNILIRILWNVDIVDSKLLFVVDLIGSSVLYLGLQCLLIYFIWEYMKNKLGIKFVMGIEVYILLISLLYSIYQTLLITTSFDNIMVSAILRMLTALGVLTWFVSIMFLFFRKDENRKIAYVLLINLFTATFVTNNLITRVLFSSFSNSTSPMIESSIMAVIYYVGIFSVIVFDGLIIYWANEDLEKIDSKQIENC